MILAYASVLFGLTGIVEWSIGLINGHGDYETYAAAFLGGAWVCAILLPLKNSGERLGEAYDEFVDQHLKALPGDKLGFSYYLGGQCDIYVLSDPKGRAHFAAWCDNQRHSFDGD